jgi:Tol biopolymer transport system component
VRDAKFADDPDAAGLYVVAADGTDARRIVAGDLRLPDWSPGGGTILYVDDDGDLRGVSAAGGAPSLVASGPDDELALSPDGEQVAFLVDSTLQVSDLESRDPRRLADDVTAFAWSPDGAAIAFVDGDGIHVIGRDGTGARLALAFGGALGLAWDAGGIAWSPDGERFAVVVAAGDASMPSVWLVGRDGGDPHPLLPLPDGEATDADAANGDVAPSWSPTWSPDGALVAFVRDGHVAVVGSDGTGLAVGFDDWTLGSPRWSPVPVADQV